MTYRITTSATEPARLIASPILAALGLSDEALCALRRQGFVAGENRGQRGPIFKLRFRLAGRQMVRYIGQDAALAAQLQLELQAWQAARKADLELAQLNAAARKMMREARRELSSQLAEAGFRFHGMAIRSKSKRT